MKAFLFLGHGMAATLDVSIGILVVAAVTNYLGIDAPWWWYAVGSFLALLPDMDILWPSITGREVTFNHHETIMHRPLVVIPIATGLAAILGGSIFATIAFICVSWHYVHDMREMGGGGIAWLWPFSRTYLSFLGNEEPEEAKMNSETESYLEWLHPTSLSVREFVLASIAFIAASFLIFNSPLIGIGVAALLWLGAGFVWGMWRIYKQKQ